MQRWARSALRATAILAAVAAGVLAAGFRGYEFGMSWSTLAGELVVGLMAGAVFAAAGIFLRAEAKWAALGVLCIAGWTVIMAETWCGIEEASFRAEVKRAGVSGLERERWWPHSSSSVYVHDGKFGAHD